jgi:Ras-related protein Ral-A
MFFFSFEKLPLNNQVFYDLMREIRSRKTEDSKTTSGRAKDKSKRRKLKCTIL